MARKEDVAKLAEELMNQRENIRNIGIVAHIDHGKCVSGDTKIALADGRFVRAAELYEEYGKSGKLVKSSAAEKVFDISGSGLKVFSLNKKEMIQEKKKVSHAWKMKEKGELVELELSTGMRIETTPEHKYLVLNEDGKIKEVKAAELRENAFIVCPKKLEHNSLSIDAFKQSALERLGKDNSFFVVLEKGRGIELKKKILENGMAKTREAIGSALGKRGFACAVYANRYRIQDYLRLAELFGISNAYDAIEKINYRQGVRKEGHSSLYLKLPSNDYEITELMYLLGVIWGDGGISGKEVRVTNESRQMQQEIKRIVAELFGREVRIKKYGGRATRIDLKLGRTFTELLIRVFGLPRKNKSHSIGIPELVQKMPKEHLKAFIQGYFDTDGTLETSRRAVSISSASRQMMGELQLNLLKFGCPATFNRKKQALYISASNMETFREKINFRLESKRKRLDAIVEKAEAPNRNTDLLPLKPAILKGLRESMSLAQGDFFPSYGPIERGQIPLYSPHLDEAVNVFYRNAGNPKIKDMNAWTEMQELEKIGRECYYPQITAIKRKKFTGWVYDFTVQGNHNFIGNGCVVHNTTMTDSLVAASGLISKELAGQQLFMDSYALEQERGITINAATISLVHEHKGVKHLINVIDTPGHIDFGGDVIRAMRAVDGVIVVVDAVEGTMPQTETVIRQALKEHVKPVLFINKVDRLVNELQVTEEEMQQRFVKAIAGVNNLIKKNVPKEFVDKWVVKVEDGSVVFGSGYYKWAVSVPRMKETEVSFKDVYRFCKEEKQKELAEKSPLHLAILQMVIDHLPNPITAQRYRTPAIWSGDKESEVGKAMLACDQNGPFAMMVTDVSVDPHAGDIASGRVYSGTVRAGMTVRALGLQKEVKLQQVGIFMGPDRVTVDAIPAGNIAALVGLKEVFAGETISTDEMKEFESFMSTAEPVMTVSVEAKHTKDLPKLIAAIRQITKEDPNIRASINNETGEHLISGMGELHLEVTQYRIETDHKIPIDVSPPIVVYKEFITKPSPILEAKSPNKHNKFKLDSEPMPKDILDKMIEMRIDGKVKPKDKEMIAKFEECGFDKEVAKKIWCVHNNCILVDLTRGIQSLHEIRELVIEGFKDAMDGGPLAKEKCMGVMVKMSDATLHEDAIHRGPAQILPVITRGIYACMLAADAILLEPKQTLTITVPQDYMGAVSKELGTRRTQISDMRTEGDSSIIVGKAPVKELIGFSKDIRSATQGRAIWTAEYAGYEPLPRELQKGIITEVRKRKGMNPEVKPYQFFLE